MIIQDCKMVDGWMWNLMFDTYLMTPIHFHELRIRISFHELHASGHEDLIRYRITKMRRTTTCCSFSCRSRLQKVRVPKLFNLPNHFRDNLWTLWGALRLLFIPNRHNIFKIIFKQNFYKNKTSSETEDLATFFAVVKHKLISNFSNLFLMFTFFQS